MKGQKSDDLESISYSYKEKEFSLLNDFPFKHLSNVYASKDSIAFFYIKNESELIMTISSDGSWKTWNIDGIFIDEIIDVKFQDLTNDSIPELILEYGFKEGIHWGGNKFRNIMIWDYHKMVCLFFEETYLFSFDNTWDESSQKRVYHESSFEVGVSFENGIMIVKNISDDNFNFSPGRYRFQDEEWTKIDL